MSWIEWFCSLEGHEFLLNVDPEFILDKFNLLKLDETLHFSAKHFNYCLHLLLAPQAPTQDELKDEEFLRLNQDASDLYGLIHARYIRSPEGKPLKVIDLCGRHGSSVQSVPKG